MARPKPEPTVQKVLITPEMAARWLEQNTSNRRLSDRWVAELRDAILAGEWQYNGDAIRRAVDGTILDGQHRLWAIYLADKACWSLVIDGLPREVQQTIDHGRRRNLADELHIQGYGMATMLSAAIGVKWRLDNKLMRTYRQPSIPTALRILKDHPDLYDACHLGHRFSRRIKGGSPAVMAALFYEFSVRDPDAAEAFFEKLIEGVGLQHGDPVFALRRHLETSKTTQVMLAALTIKAWNYHLEGREITNLTWRPVGRNPEAFPEINDV